MFRSAGPCRAVLSTLNLFALRKTHCPKPPGDVISLRHETEADGTPISESARCGSGNKTKTTRTKI
jgi:hypothetical protein